MRLLEKFLGGLIREGLQRRLEGRILGDQIAAGIGIKEKELILVVHCEKG